MSLFKYSTVVNAGERDPAHYYNRVVTLRASFRSVGRLLKTSIAGQKYFITFRRALQFRCHGAPSINLRALSVPCRDALFAVADGTHHESSSTCTSTCTSFCLQLRPSGRKINPTFFISTDDAVSTVISIPHDALDKSLSTSSSRQCNERKGRPIGRLQGVMLDPPVPPHRLGRTRHAHSWANWFRTIELEWIA
ncbi:hypothetical protein EVAR_43414_1 [Eumeta japonica]|uniref:Uncharacterized protein n=1 Tax=Eumeta variegata TaxID=151549 RepID=A0A4C1WV91_EUMVA|nr:hypothetical protein EVAR_43414_1 [Eumeta japonica]